MGLPDTSTTLSSCHIQHHLSSSSPVRHRDKEQEIRDEEEKSNHSSACWWAEPAQRALSPGHKPSLLHCSHQETWAMLTAWCLGAPDPKDTGVLKAPTWIRGRHFLQRRSVMGLRTAAGAPEGDRYFCTVLSLSPKALPGCKPGGATRTLQWNHRDLCHHHSDVAQSHLGKPGLSFHIKPSTNFPVL